MRLVGLGGSAHLACDGPELVERALEPRPRPPAGSWVQRRVACVSVAHPTCTARVATSSSTPRARSASTRTSTRCAPLASSRSRSAAEAAMTRARGSETGRLRSRIATIDRKAPSSVARRRRHARRVACLPAGDAGVRVGRRRSRRRPPARERPKARRGARDPPVTDPVACSVTPGRPRLAPQTTLARRGASRYLARPSSDRRVGRTYAAPEPVEGLRHGGSNRGFGSSAGNDLTGNSAGPRSATALSAGLSRSHMSHHKFWANYRGMGGALPWTRTS